MIQFTAKTDAVLHEHLRRAIKNSKIRKLNLEDGNKMHSKGRGSLVTLLSKSIVDKVILRIMKSMINKIKNEIGQQKFSIEMDNTQDIG